MNLKFHNIYLYSLLALFSVQVRLTTSCSCFPFPNAKIPFCAADYVIQVKILEESAPIIPDMMLDIGDTQLSEIEKMYLDYWKSQMAKYQYKIEIIKVFRKTSEYDGASKVLQTFGNTEMCGTRLEPGHTYFIIGNVEEFESDQTILGLNSCDYTVDLGKSRTYTKEALELMKNGVNCDDPSIYFDMLSFRRRTTADEPAA